MDFFLLKHLSAYLKFIKMHVILNKTNGNKFEAFLLFKYISGKYFATFCTWFLVKVFELFFLRLF